MQRLTLVAAGAVALAAGILLFRSAGEVPLAVEEQRAERSHHDRIPEAFSEGRHRLRETEAHDSFLDREREIAAMPQDTARENAVRDLAGEWAKQSPLAAERWARSLDDPADRERALTHVCLEVAAQDPREALRIAQENELHQGMVESTAARWAAADFDAAFAWVEAMPHGESRDRLLSRFIQGHATKAPAEAAEMLSKSALCATPHEEAVIAIVHQWLLKDPEAVGQWVDRFPEGSVRARALAEIQGTTR